LADASSLVLPETGLLRAGDPRFRTPLDVIGKRLLMNGFLKHVDADDFGNPSNALVTRAFWYIDLLSRVGRPDGVPSLILFAMRLFRTPEERLWHAS
jgi:GH15 family glucan-1,4-alpha-glucosidase